MKIKFEHTDTFGRDANYSWVKRGEVDVPDKATDLQIVRAVKLALGMNGVKCDKEEWNGMIVLRPRRICQIIFIGEMI